MLNNTDKSTYTVGKIGQASIERSAFCWRPYWASRFESLWSLLRKFAHLNAITHSQIHRLFASDASWKLGWTSFSRADLRHFGALDPAKLSIIFDIGDKALSEATVLQYVHEREAGILTSDFLRFCPTCIYQGFHSPLYQLKFLTECPVHGEQLEIRCTECITDTIPYKLPSVSSRDMSHCVHMSHGLNQHLTYSDVNHLRKEAVVREKALSSVAQWLTKRVELNAPEQPITQLVPLGAGRRYFMRRLRRLPVYWIEVFGIKRGMGSIVPETVGTHSQVRHKETSLTKERGNSLDAKASMPERAAESWNSELYKIYKSISRHLVRSYLLPHRRCIIRRDRRFLWPERTRTWLGNICPAINALLLWQMHWEGIDHPDMLFRPRWRPHDYQHPRLHWDAPSIALPRWVLRRLFALECVGLFHECVLLAEALYRKNVYSFYPRYLKGRRMPHWLVEKSEGDEFTIHWWVSRSLSSLMSQNSSHFTSRRAKSCPG